MTWTMLAIRQLNDGADGVLYPKPTGERNGIVLDEWDGQCAHPITATRIELKELVAGSGKSKTILKAESVKVAVYITESRVAFACSKYDKGGGWIGGVTAVALNAASKARAAIRSQGKSLVGHVRYPWIDSVGFSPKTGWLSEEKLRVVAADKTDGVKTTYLLDLTLPKSISAEKVAREITQRAAQFRLARTSFDSAEEREAVEALVDPPQRRADNKSMGMWSFPTYFFARPSTAFGNIENTGSAGVVGAPALEPVDAPPSTEVANGEVSWWQP